MSGGIVSGRRFNSENEYNLAIEDAELILKLRKCTDMTDPDSVRKLYESMQSGEIRFNTVIGRDFDDEIYDLTLRLQRKEVTEEPKSKKTYKKTRTNKTASNNKQKRTASERPAKKYDQKSVDAAAQEILRKANNRRRLIVALAGVVAVCSMTYFIIYSKSAYNAQHAYDELASLKGTNPVSDNIETKPLFTLAEADEIPELLDEYKNIYLKNKSVIGWITIDGTNIDYPVMQTVNNDYYLKHNFEGKDDNNGALFLDYQCNAMFRSDNMIIYGHHMKSGKMFGNLKKYQNEDYCKKHNIIQFDTVFEKSTYQVMYVFKADISNAEDVSFKYYQFIDAVSEEEYMSNLNEMAKMSFFDTGVKAEYGDELLTLSTCDGTTSTTRFVVVAKRIK